MSSWKWTGMLDRKLILDIHPADEEYAQTHITRMNTRRPGLHCKPPLRPHLPELHLNPISLYLQSIGIIIIKRRTPLCPAPALCLCVYVWEAGRCLPPGVRSMKQLDSAPGHRQIICTAAAPWYIWRQMHRKEGRVHADRGGTTCSVLFQLSAGRLRLQNLLKGLWVLFFVFFLVFFSYLGVYI